LIADAPRAEWNVVLRILLIRHASTETRQRLCGSFDVPLSPAGRAEVETLVRRPVTRPAPDALFTSTLRRAMDVAVAVGRAWMVDPRPAEWAREIHCGDVEGMRLDDVKRRFPDLWARNEAQEDDTFAWPGGESYDDFRARIVAGLRTIVESQPGGRVAVVTHAGVISQVVGLIRGRRAARWEPDRPQPLTGTEIAWRNGVPDTLLSYDDPDWW
jgi:probable phosphoglycerate mutase